VRRATITWALAISQPTIALSYVSVIETIRRYGRSHNIRGIVSVRRRKHGSAAPRGAIRHRAAPALAGRDKTMTVTTRPYDHKPHFLPISCRRSLIFCGSFETSRLSEGSGAQHRAAVNVHPRDHHFNEDIIQAFCHAIKHTPDIEFGRCYLCSVIRGSAGVRMKRPRPDNPLGQRSQVPRAAQ
jgi:hypothetical protein